MNVSPHRLWRSHGPFRVFHHLPDVEPKLWSSPSRSKVGRPSVLEASSAMKESSTPPAAPVAFLEVQSEQLAQQLQEADEGITASNRSAPSTQEPAVARTTTPLQVTPGVQGAWATGGQTAAEVLLGANSLKAFGGESASPESACPQKASRLSDDQGLSTVPVSSSALSAMVAMGIEESWAASALRRCGGSDVAEALDFCFSHDMAPLAEADARLLSTLTQDPDADMALAVALEEEERRAYDVTRRARVASSKMGTEEGAFGPKVKFASAADFASGGPGAGVEFLDSGDDAHDEGRRWGAADAEQMSASEMVPGRPGSETARRQKAQKGQKTAGSGAGKEAAEGGHVAADGRSLDEEEAACMPLPGGGRMKGKMPLFTTAEGETVSKHDAVISGRMNARDASNNLDGVGDLTFSDIRLSNRTYNSLKKGIRRKHEKGMATVGRVEGATRSTQEGVMDEYTRLLVFKMINAGTLLEVHGMVKTGKEAHVYHAVAPESENHSGFGNRLDVAMKIFKTTLNEFGNRAAYVDGDPRYTDIRFNKQSRRKMFTIWAKKEHRNLIRMHRAGVPCPEPILQREHVLLMSFIGTDNWPAPQLRELDLSAANWRKCYAQALELTRIMYQRCSLVHADLSEYNILYHRKVCYVIDVGQAVDLGHSKAGEYLARDISVITEFFRRQGVVGCLKADAANQFVVGYAGPSEHEFETELGSVKENQQERKERGGDDKNEDEETPLTGYQFILEIMETPADEVGSALRDACEEAELWSSRYRQNGHDADLGGDDDHFGDEDGIDDEDDEETEDGGVDNGDGDGAEEIDASVDKIGGGGVNSERARSARGDASSHIGNDAAREVDRGDSHVEDSKPRGSGKRGEKVALGERERARTAEVKEILKAGLSLP